MLLGPRDNRGGGRVRREVGIIIVSGLGVEQQIPTGVCAHCNRVLKLDRDPQVSEEGGWCLKCNRILCKIPQCHNDCNPYIARALKSVGY